MQSFSEFAAQRAREQQQQDTSAASIVLDAVVVAPDEMAGDLKLANDYAQTTGKPVPPIPLVSENRPIFEREIERRRNSSILSQAPRLSEWLRDPQNAALARDDLDGLSWWEAAGNALNRGVQRLPQSVNQFGAFGAAERAGDQSRGFLDLLSEETSIRDGAGNVVGQKLLPGPGDVFSAGSRYLQSRISDLSGIDETAVAAQFQQRVGEIAQKISSIPMSEAGSRYRDEFVKLEPSGSVMDDFASFASTVAKDPTGFISFLTETAVESAPSLVAAAGVGIATRSPIAAAGAMGGYSGALEAGISPAEFFQEKGIDISTPEGAMAAISDPQIMQEASERGVIRGVIIGSLDTLSGGIAGQTLAKSRVGNLAIQSVVQALFGAGGEAGAQVAAGQDFNLFEVMIEGLAEFVTAPIEVGVMTSSVFLERQGRARAAEERQAVFQEIAGQAVNSKVRARMPEAFRNFVARATENGPVENVYVPADQFVTYFQGRDIDPFELAGTLDGVTEEDLRTALATGGDVRIPTSTYAAKIAGSEHDAFLFENMRFDPMDMTAAEARAFNERSADAMEEAYAEAERMRLEEEQFRSFEAEIYDTMVSRLRQAGRSTDVATTEAMLYPAFYRVMAERSGMTTEEFMQRYPLPQVRGDRPEGMQLQNVDALNRTLAAARNQRGVAADSRQTLLEFISERGGIIDRGGELRSRNAAQVRRGRGKKTLRLERDPDMTSDVDARFGVDDVALAAFESGFLDDTQAGQEYRAALNEGREAPDIVSALWEAIDRELEGDTVRAGEADAAVTADQELAQIEQYLSEIGMSLDDSDDVIRAAIEADQEARGREYAQSADQDSFLGHDGGEQIDAVLAGDRRDTPIMFPAVPQVLAAMGVSNTPVALTPQVIKKAGVGKHNLTADQIKQAIDGLSDPVMVFDSLTSPGGLVFLVEVAGEPRPIVVAVHPEERIGRTSVSKIATIHAKDRSSAIRTWTEMGLTRYINRRSAGSWFQSRGLSLPKEGNRNRLGKKVLQHRDVFKGTERRSPRTLFQDQGGPRGSVSFPTAGVGNGETIVSLFRTANLSTFVHETGHYFLTVLQDMAQNGEASAASEMSAVRGWWRENSAAVAADAVRVMPDVAVTSADVEASIDTGTSGDLVKDAAIDVGMQEQFARAFEAYLLEGNAPSTGLRAAFEKMRAWMLSIYRRLAGLNVAPSAELREVFDRMLASDDEIAAARTQAADVGILASAEDLGLSAAEYEGLVRLHGEAQNEANARLLREAMEPIRRERQKEYKEERARVRGEVEQEVNGYRQYRALEWMGNRRWLGEGQPDSLPDMRLSKDILVQRYGEGVLKTLPRGKQTIYAVEGGVDPDDAAGLFGFQSGDEMIRLLEQSPPRRQVIENQTDKVMAERHNDPLVDGSIQVDAMDAIHNDKRAQALAMELRALNEIAGLDRGLTHKEAREIARQTLSRTRVRDAMAANRYLAAERKAAEEAQRLASIVTRTGAWMNSARRRVQNQSRAAVREGDPSMTTAIPAQVERANSSTGRFNEQASRLVEAKRRQLMNHMLYEEARRIGGEVEAAERLAARLQSRSGRDRLAGDYLEAIDDILVNYDFRKLSRRDEERRGALNAYVERMKAEGRENELAIPELVLQNAGRVPYKAITVEHLRGVVDSLKNIEHTARFKQKLLDAKSERELDAVVVDILQSFDANVKKRPPGRVRENSEGRRRSVRSFLNLVLNATTLLREIDGFQDFGATYRNIKSPIDDAMNRLTIRRQQAANDLDGLYSVYSTAERRRMGIREHIPAIGASLSKWERIAVALNMGNDGNYQRLTDERVRGGFTEAQVEAIVATLDEKDARFIQSVWDYIETFRSDIEAREKRVTGVAPKWVEARPVIIAGQTLKGGYFPLRYDARLSAAARDDAAQDIATALQAGRFGKAQTKNGHLKERAKASGRAVDLDMAVLHKHVQQVVYDIELSEPVANSWRILQDGRIRSAFIDSGKQADFDALEIWLKDVAEGEIRSADFAGSLARRLKSNFTAAKLAFNLSTVAVQVTGVAQSMVVVGKRDFAVGVQEMIGRGLFTVADEVAAKSSFMAERTSTFNKDIYDMYNDPKMGPVMSRWSEFRSNVIGPLGLWLMTKVQLYAVDLPTWLAGYNQGLRKFGNDEAKAIRYADDIVKRSQASGLFSDRTPIERGSASMQHRQNDFLRLFTALGSYMFAKFNVAYERTARAGRVIQEEGASLRSVQEALSWTMDVAFLFTLEAVLYAAIKGRLPDGDEDEDDTWMKFLAKETGLSIASTIPFVRDIGSSISGFSAGGSYGAIIDEIGRPLVQMSQGEVDKALVKSIVNTGGLFTGLPSGQANRILDAGWRAAEGEDVSPAEFLIGRIGK